MRKLASIRKISRIDPIPGKDRIAPATVDRRSVIVNKADFAEGSLCVFVEIDLILPDRNVMIGDDVTEILGIRQHEPTMDVERKNKRSDRAVRRSRLAKNLMRFKWFRDPAYITKRKKQSFESGSDKGGRSIDRRLRICLTVKTSLIQKTTTGGNISVQIKLLRTFGAYPILF